MKKHNIKAYDFFKNNDDREERVKSSLLTGEEKR